MAELGEALVAMHAARHRFRTLRATVRERHDGPLSQRAAERYAETPEGKQSGFADIVRERAEAGESWQTTTEGLWRIWFDRPDRLRTERDDPLRGPELGISDGERWWMYDREYRPYSNEDDLSVGSGIGDEAEFLLDPSPLLAPLRFEACGREQIAGRSAIRLRGSARPGRHHSFALMRLGHGVSEIELCVDRERGILLRQALLLDERPYQVTELVEVAFDESFSAETFTFVLPPDETRRPGDEPEAREVTVEEAVALAPFSVFMLELAEEWERRASYFPGDDRHGYPPVVSFQYRLPDASHRILLVERETGTRDPLDDHFEWQQREFDGERVEVSPQERPMETRVRLDRDGTSITLSSESLDLNQLLDMTRALRHVA
jgi:outer membrane lipoprotein-sorting protein